jgi:two-component system response regulator CpxR
VIELSDAKMALDLNANVMSEPETQLPLEDTTPRQSLLLVDDDIKFCRLISDYLHRYGYVVSFAHEGKTALKMMAEGSWDAVILDVMLPQMDGFEILRRIRETSEVPVLMLTALGDETDRIVGLEIGADDYLPKSYSPRELLARLKAVLRRSGRTQSENKEDENEELVVGGLVISQSAHTARLNGETLALTPVEYHLLVVLAQAAGRIKSREQLLNEIRDRNYDVFDRSIDVHVSALRRKLGDDPKSPKFIRTVRSVGYMLIPPQEPGR